MQRAVRSGQHKVQQPRRTSTTPARATPQAVGEPGLTGLQFSATAYTTVWTPIPNTCTFINTVDGTGGDLLEEGQNTNTKNTIQKETDNAGNLKHSGGSIRRLLSRSGSIAKKATTATGNVPRSMPTSQQHDGDITAGSKQARSQSEPRTRIHSKGSPKKSATTPNISRSGSIGSASKIPVATDLKRALEKKVTAPSTPIQRSRSIVRFLSKTGKDRAESERLVAGAVQILKPLSSLSDKFRGATGFLESTKSVESSFSHAQVKLNHILRRKRIRAQTMARQSIEELFPFDLLLPVQYHLGSPPPAEETPRQNTSKTASPTNTGQLLDLAHSVKRPQGRGRLDSIGRLIRNEYGNLTPGQVAKIDEWVGGTVEQKDYEEGCCFALSTQHLKTIGGDPIRDFEQIKKYYGPTSTPAEQVDPEDFVGPFAGELVEEREGTHRKDLVKLLGIREGSGFLILTNYNDYHNPYNQSDYYGLPLIEPDRVLLPQDEAWVTGEPNNGTRFLSDDVGFDSLSDESEYELNVQAIPTAVTNRMKTAKKVSKANEVNLIAIHESHELDEAEIGDGLTLVEALDHISLQDIKPKVPPKFKTEIEVEAERERIRLDDEFRGKIFQEALLQDSDDEDDDYVSDDNVSISEEEGTQFRPKRSHLPAQSLLLYLYGKGEFIPSTVSKLSTLSPTFLYNSTSPWWNGYRIPEYWHFDDSIAKKIFEIAKRDLEEWGLAGARDRMGRTYPKAWKDSRRRLSEAALRKWCLKVVENYFYWRLQDGMVLNIDVLH
jgi:hypothetical protein